MTNHAGDIWSLCSNAWQKETSLGRGVASPDCPGGQSWWASRWRVSANCALARTGGCLRGDVPPSEAGRFWNFDTEFTQFSDNFYAKFIPLEMFKYLWNIMFINVSYKSAMFFNLGLGLNVSVKVGGSLHTGTPSISLINFGVRTYAQKVRPGLKLDLV